jgi:membrane-associated protease RseP (regulator of RpoE activity)
VQLQREKTRPLSQEQRFSSDRMLGQSSRRRHHVKIVFTVSATFADDRRDSRMMSQNVYTAEMSVAGSRASGMPGFVKATDPAIYRNARKANNPNRCIIVRIGFISMALVQGCASWTGWANQEIVPQEIFQGRNDPGAIVQHDGPETAASCGWIGAQVRPITAPIAASLGMAVPYGAIFDRPEAASPASRAGIEAGDVITAINGTPIMRAGDFISVITKQAPGTPVSLSIWRNGMFIRVALTLGSSECHGKRQDARTERGTLQHRSPRFVL